MLRNYYLFNNVCIFLIIEKGKCTIQYSCMRRYTQREFW